MLGKIYYNGIHVEQDYQKAYEAFASSYPLGAWNNDYFDTDEDEAVFYLGFMYYNGLGVKKNVEKAKELFEYSIVDTIVNLKRCSEELIIKILHSVKLKIKISPFH